MPFSDLLTSPELLHNLGKVNFTVPTPIQEQAIGPILAGENVVGIAHTGTGKTLAFALPIIERLTTNPGIALIIVPTRELAVQMEVSIRRFSRGVPHMNPSVLISGVPMDRQHDSLKTKPRLIIATPGRLNEHLDARNFSIKNVSIVVLDEADRILTSGFAPQIERILDRTVNTRQTLLFSATMPPIVTRLQERYAPKATVIEIKERLATESKVTHQAYRITATRRAALLTRLIHETAGSIMVFVSRKVAAQHLYGDLEASRLSLASLHGDRSVAARKDAIEGFRKGTYKVLVTTDLAARGIDIPAIALVVNYDLPQDGDLYIHRAGRTGRAGKPGRVISFATPPELPQLASLEAELGLAIGIIEKED
jgi:ATP-dependent RNA helicase RhlE